MCLSKFSKRKPASTGTGYKVFVHSGDSGRLYGTVYSQWRRESTWLKAKGPKSNPNVGFHIYKRKADALHRATFGFSKVVRRVRYRGAHHQGLGDGSGNLVPVVVSKYMYILKGEVK